MKKYIILLFLSTSSAHTADQTKKNFDTKINVKLFWHHTVDRPPLMHTLVTSENMRFNTVARAIKNTYAIEGRLIFNSQIAGKHKKQINVTDSFDKLSDFDTHVYTLTFNAVPVTTRSQQPSINTQAHAHI